MQFRNHELIGPARFRNVSGLLLVFVVISLLAHGGTLLLSSENDIKLPEKQLGAAVISAVLVTANDNPAPPPADKVPAKTTNNKPTYKTSEPPRKTVHTQNTYSSTTTGKSSTQAPRKTGAPEIQHRNLAQPQKHLAAPVETIKTNPSTRESFARRKEEQRNYLLGELQNRLSKYLTYPPNARRRGWQGEVIVAFNINALGQLNNFRVARSSGYSLLDNSALNAISKLHTITTPVQLGPLQAMDLQLPVHYRLQES